MDELNQNPVKDRIKHPTLSDVALQAGVSYATADRVINDRGNVAEKSVLKVHDAMQALGYVRNVAAANLSRGRTYRLAFLLPTVRNSFFSRPSEHLRSLTDHLAADQTHVDVIEIDAFKSKGLKQSLSSILNAEYDGVAVVGLQSDEIIEPLEKLRAQGTAVVGLVSDLPEAHREAYIGIDNVAAGRTAARLLGWAHAGRKGLVQVIAGSREASDHVDRLTGFHEVIARDFPNVDVLEPVMTRDMADEVHAIVSTALAGKPAVSGIYNVGAGNTGFASAIEQSSLKDRPFCILHELTKNSYNALANNVFDIVIDQRPAEEIDRALTILKALIDKRTIPPMQDLIPTIYVRDNLPTIPSTENQLI